jgi:hypothetical protein
MQKHLERNILLITAILSIFTGLFVVRCSFMNYPNQYCHWYHRFTGTMGVITGVMMLFTLWTGSSLL